MTQSLPMQMPSLGTLGLASLVLVFTGCTTGDSPSSGQAQPPVIVVQAPPETTTISGAAEDPEYPGLAWKAPTNPDAEAGEAPNQDTEPYDVVALLREFDPQLTDAPKDQKSETAFDDILSAFAVMDEAYLYGRLLTRAPMQGDDAREVRFWLEQGKQMATVEVKVGTRGSPCELSDANKSDAQNVVPQCFWTGNALDFRIPLDKIPDIIDTEKPFWASGFQTCCQDPERNKPYDELKGAQEIWRVPGMASEVETK
ncbi:MAG: hypothetical protein VX498_15960 [Myxococcota bacterium]|nr:hypothetical protein [Myxococcota bacterium]